MSSSDDRPTLLFSKNSLENTTLACDALGIHYEISTPTGVHATKVTTLSRWDRYSEQVNVIAEWERNLVGKDRFRVVRSSGGEVDGEFRTSDEFIPLTWLGYPIL